MPWLIYALGGGWGHLMRSLALGRIAAQTRPVIILCNSPYATKLLDYVADNRQQEPANPTSLSLSPTPYFLPVVDRCYIQTIPSQATFKETCDRIYQIITGKPYDCLIVDTFPRGLGGELADILPQLKNTPRILIHRDINPDYVRAKDLQRFVADHFDLVLVPGELGELPFAHLPQVQHTAPWLIRSANELPNRAKARTLLRLDPREESKVILVCAAGRAEELAFYGQLAKELANAFIGVTVRCLSAECPTNCPSELWVFHVPGIECLPAVDVVVGGAGYNTFHECVAVNLPVVMFAFKRQYDRQQMRVKRWCDRQQRSPVRLVESVEEAMNAVADFLQFSRYHQPNFLNGAIEAVRSIEQVI